MRAPRSWPLPHAQLQPGVQSLLQHARVDGGLPAQAGGRLPTVGHRGRVPAQPHALGSLPRRHRRTRAMGFVVLKPPSEQPMLQGSHSLRHWLQCQQVSAPPCAASIEGVPVCLTVRMSHLQGAQHAGLHSDGRKDTFISHHQPACIANFATTHACAAASSCLQGAGPAGPRRLARQLLNILHAPQALLCRDALCSKTC